MSTKMLRDVIALAVAEYVKSYPHQELTALCCTARDWHDGPSSLLFQFAKSNGLLKDIRTYGRLFKEVHKALCECRLEATDDRERLLQLSEFAQKVSVFEQSLRHLSGYAQVLHRFNIPEDTLRLVIEQSR